ncbi:bis(5'-nucleosyl)-tetraphosphatase [Metamycoplasma spumans]|uniref:bis(5'-nucleosyl)-tetraphosphatase n=1 Tax=Metamycoplasma spumans TaxID=92406 RepID=UPI000B148949
MIKYEKSCGAVVFKKENNVIKVLLIEQKAGHWGFPKGHVEENETEIETALREVKEETNIDVKIIENFREIIEYQPFENAWKTVVFFVAEPINNTLIKQETEVQSLGWFNIEKVNELLPFDTQKEIFNKAIKFYLQLNKN